MQASPVLVSSDDLYLFNTGQLFRAYRTFGAHSMDFEGRSGVRFVLWAPQAREVSVVGDFNDWNGLIHSIKLAPIGTTGIWAGFGPGLGDGDHYKYEIVSAG